MIALVDQVLRDLQGAVAVRNLYPSDHPRVIDSIARVAAGVGQAAADGEIAVYALDQRVVHDGTPLPSSESLWRGLFAWIGAHGFHRLALRRGVTAGELADFVAALSDCSRGGPASLASTPHVRLSTTDAGPPAARAVELVPELAMPEAGPTLGKLWRGVMEHRTLEFEALEVTVLALVRTVERHQGALLPLAVLRDHDDYTVAHIVNVALLAIALSEAVGYGPALVRDIGVAAILHDIGKLRVPADVLNAPGRLTEEQRALVRRHPEDGARMLMGTPGVPALAVSVAFEHHMHYDGSGYPSVPAGWRMNAASEITHIADVFDALRSRRPYREGLPADRVAQVMLRDTGTVFCPALLRVFFEAVAPRTPMLQAA